MALPLIGFYALLALIGILFFLGFSRYNVNASLAFMVFASVLMLTTSMFIINDGLQLNTQESIDPDTGVIAWQTVSYDINSWNWLRVITDVLFWGGFVGIIFGFAYNFQRSKSRQVSEWDM
jgi:hypothetical protein